MHYRVNSTFIGPCADSAAYPFVPVWHIYARTSMTDRKEKVSSSVARQMLSQSLDPPPPILPDHSNVGQIRIIAERSHEWELPLAERWAFITSCNPAAPQYTGPRNVVSTVNLDRPIQRELDLATLSKAWRGSVGAGHERGSGSELVFGLGRGR